MQEMFRAIISQNADFDKLGTVQKALHEVDSVQNGLYGAGLIQNLFHRAGSAQFRAPDVTHTRHRLYT